MQGHKEPLRGVDVSVTLIVVIVSWLSTSVEVCQVVHSLSLCSLLYVPYTSKKLEGRRGYGRRIGYAALFWSHKKNMRLQSFLAAPAEPFLALSHVLL